MKKDKVVFDLIAKELERQESGIELIASEKLCVEAGNAGPGNSAYEQICRRPSRQTIYGGCEVVDEIEQLAIDRVKELFGASWANVQPHSGAQANAAVMLACLKAGRQDPRLRPISRRTPDTWVAGQFSGKLYQPVFYGVEQETGTIDFDKILSIAEREKPKMIICGASAYSRDWDYKKLRAAADAVGALVLADVSHPAGLIARGLLSDPLEYCHIVTTTTHKTLRGPRGGVIMVGKKLRQPVGP